MAFPLKNLDIAKGRNDKPDGLQIMKLVKKNKETRKSVPILVQSFSGRDESGDLIYIFRVGQIDKN